MNGEKIYKALFSSEDGVLLASQKIELLKDLGFSKFTEIEKKAETMYKPHLDIMNEAFKLNQKALSEAKKAEKELRTFYGNVKMSKERFESSVKQLGINPSELKQPKEYDKQLTRVEALLNQVLKHIKDLSK